MRKLAIYVALIACLGFIFIAGQAMAAGTCVTIKSGLILDSNRRLRHNLWQDHKGDT